MHQEVVDQHNLERDLREAVDQRAFTIAYEPIVDLESGEPRAIEALIRWPHPERGLIGPSDFIGIAEETGLIVPMGEWVLEQACLKLAELQERDPRFKGLKLHVNLSRQQLGHPGLVASVQRAIEHSGIEPERLYLEITENMIMAHVEVVTEALDRIKAFGARVVMDDFGTGHSSLSCLHQFPIDVLKIDRSFVSGEHGKGAIVNAIIALAHNLDLQIVAEGIETEDQIQLLKSLNCGLGQGRYFEGTTHPDTSALLAVTRTDFNQAA